MSSPNENDIVLAKGADGHNMTPLPLDFTPGANDVICGRGRRIFDFVGNQQFRQLVALHLEEYSAAETKVEKTKVLAKIVVLVRERSPGGGFVKKSLETKRWFEVGDFLAREKTSQAFRDLLHEKYSSSNEAKRRKRNSKTDLVLAASASNPALNRPMTENYLIEALRNKRRIVSADSMGALASFTRDQDGSGTGNFQWGNTQTNTMSKSLFAGFAGAQGTTNRQQQQNGAASLFFQPVANLQSGSDSISFPRQSAAQVVHPSTTASMNNLLELFQARQGAPQQHNQSSGGESQLLSQQQQYFNHPGQQHQQEQFQQSQSQFQPMLESLNENMIPFPAYGGPSDHAAGRDEVGQQNMPLLNLLSSSDGQSNNTDEEFDLRQFLMTLSNS